MKTTKREALPAYSILMSVYYKENPDWFRLSIESMLNQSVLSDDFVVVCDGALTDSLYQVLYSFSKNPSNNIHIVQLEKNSGLGNALNEGLQYCKNEIVARMDSDDISKPQRCEKELSAIIAHNADIVSSALEEFLGDTSNIVGQRLLPENNQEIKKFSRRRSPFNHPTVMFKKSAVLAAGSYSGKYHLFEDYYLWVRMLMNGAVGFNLRESLLYMRVSKDMYKRRGGIAYAKSLLSFHRWMKTSGWTSAKDYYLGAVPHGIVCIMPNYLRGLIYKILHRKI